MLVLDSLLNKSPKGLSWNYTIAYRELYPTGKYYHKYLCERHPRSTSFPGTGCWVPLTIAHWMVFMNMYSEVIFRSEGHCAHILITSISQGRWRRWCSRWCHRWGWRRCACGRKSFFLFRKNILLPLHMGWWHLKSIWSLRAPLLFRSWRVLLFLGIELFSSPGISPKRWGTGLLLGPWSLAPGGVQGEGEGRTNRKGEVEDLALAGQCLAEIHALGDQGGVSFNHCSHFGLTSESVKN